LREEKPLCPRVVSPQILSVVKVFGKREVIGEREPFFFAKATYCVFKKGFSPLKKFPFEELLKSWGNFYRPDFPLDILQLN